MNEKNYKVWHTLIVDGLNKGHYISDMIYDNDVPFLVFEWLQTPEGEVPSIRVQLNPNNLHKTNMTDVDFVYEFPVEHPVPSRYNKHRKE